MELLLAAAENGRFAASRALTGHRELPFSCRVGLRVASQESKASHDSGKSASSAKSL
jgi:hypothetical protein